MQAEMVERIKHATGDPKAGEAKVLSAEQIKDIIASSIANKLAVENAIDVDAETPTTTAATTGESMDTAFCKPILPEIQSIPMLTP